MHIVQGTGFGVLACRGGFGVQGSRVQRSGFKVLGLRVWVWAHGVDEGLGAHHGFDAVVRRRQTW